MLSSRLDNGTKWCTKSRGKNKHRCKFCPSTTTREAGTGQKTAKKQQHKPTATTATTATTALTQSNTSHTMFFKRRSSE
eukprot:6439445-Ditylum_brightwellii.AAC.1